MAESNKCVKCGGKMEQGVIVDHKYTSTTQSKWAKATTLFGSRGRRNIDSYRCKKCGYIENYAL